MALLAVGAMAAAAHAYVAARAGKGELAVMAAWAEELELTDLCLFTEARYTRHPSQADRFAPFQEHPAALDHFPSGALIAPPGGRY